MALLTPWLWTFSSQHSERINFCSKSFHLWEFVMTALGSYIYLQPMLGFSEHCLPFFWCNSSRLNSPSGSSVTTLLSPMHLLSSQSWMSWPFPSIHLQIILVDRTPSRSPLSRFISSLRVLRCPNCGFGEHVPYSIFCSPIFCFSIFTQRRGEDSIQSTDVRTRGISFISWLHPLMSLRS